MTLVRYFAYGSNMLTARLQARCPSARPLGLATARGRRLAFHKRSDVDGSGKCDLVPADDGALVVGVVFDLAADELPALDRAEGRGQGYERREIVVELGGDRIACESYVATDIEPELMPYGWYRQLVLAGLLEHGAPAAYVEQVRQVAWRADPLPERHGRLAAMRALAAFRERHPDLAVHLLAAEER